MGIKECSARLREKYRAAHASELTQRANPLLETPQGRGVSAASLCANLRGLSALMRTCRGSVARELVSTSHMEILRKGTSGIIATLDASMMRVVAI